MKNIALLLFSILIFSSCENFDDPIPDGSVLETPTLSTKLTSENSVELRWSSAQICAGFCPSIVPASTYEVWVKSLTSTTNYKLAEIPAGQMSYLVEGLEAGVEQEFFVIAKRANVSNKTNRVMVVPNELPVAASVFQKEGADYITYPQASPSGDKITYTVSQSGSFSNSQEVFIYDLASKSHQLVSENGLYPSWSAAGDKLTFVSNDENSSVVNEYSLTSKTKREIVADTYQSYFPVYVAEDASLVYFLDSLEEGDQSLLSFNLSVEATNPKASLSDVDYNENSPYPLLGMNYSPELTSIAFAAAYTKETATGFSYDILGFTLASPSSLKSLVVSDWNDSNPSFSISDPNLLAFVSDRSGIAQVWIKDVSTQQLIQVTDFQESVRINVGIVGLSWSGDELFVNIQEGAGNTQLVKIDISELLEN